MTGSSSGQPVEITIVQAPACHLCEDAHAAVETLAAEYPLSIRLEDITSAEGQRLIQVHRPAMNPLVLVGGEFFSAGRLPRGKLRRLLDRTVATTAQAG